MYDLRYSCQISMKYHFFEKYSNIIFYENPFRKDRVVPSAGRDGRTDGKSNKKT